MSGFEERIEGLLREQGVDVDRVKALGAEMHDEETYRLALMAADFAGPRLTRGGWLQRQPCADGLGIWDQPRRGFRLMHTIARHDGDAWAHVSLSRRDRTLPTWEQTRDAWRLLYPSVAGVVVIPPEDEHLSFGEVMHVWGNLSRPAVPDFSMGTGTI